MKRKGEIKVIINYPSDKEKLNGIDKIKLSGILDIVLRNKNIDTNDKERS